MAKKTVITKVLGIEAQESVIEFPQNRTLYADQFTDRGPVTDEDRNGFNATSMEEVFKKYQPQKGIKLKTEDGKIIEETFEFKSIQDFEDEQLIKYSKLLRKEQDNIDAYNSIIHHLQNDETLKEAIKDDTLRSDLRNALMALLAELNDNEE